MSGSSRSYLEIVAGGGNTERVMSPKDKQPMRKISCRFKACRGTKGGCPHSLVDGRSVGRSIEDAVTDSMQVESASGQNHDGASHRPGLRIALAACPNACTEPQTKDIGIIATVMPVEVGSQCTGCGECEKICREEAIKVIDGEAQILAERCVGCGQCISRCPEEIIRSFGLRFRLLVGGRMGRHPRLAEELCVLDGSVAAEAVRGLLDSIAHHAEQGERTASVVERVGITNLREQVFVNV